MPARLASADALLAADIGATHARFVVAAGDGPAAAPVVLATRDFATAAALLDAALAALNCEAPAAACLAIAGPVDGNRGRITNGSLAFDRSAAAAQLGCPLLLVNDFFALARALPLLERLQPIGAGQAEPGGVMAVLGPGSGLGMGALVPVPSGWRVLASEGGHADLAPGSPLEAELLGALQRRHGHVSWETVLSGPGLVRLYGAVCELWGVEPEVVDPEWISANGVGAAEPVCHQTLEIFCGLLGAAAGNLALTVYATGGVYLGGGILPGMADFLLQSPLRRRFEERGPLTGSVQRMPLNLILDPAPGLTGALAWLRDERGAGNAIS
ncbi:MAG: glucokinase [Pseudomonadales bacterium]